MIHAIQARPWYLPTLHVLVIWLCLAVRWEGEHVAFSEELWRVFVYVWTYAHTYKYLDGTRTGQQCIPSQNVLTPASAVRISCLAYCLCKRWLSSDRRLWKSSAQSSLFLFENAPCFPVCFMWLFELETIRNFPSSRFLLVTDILSKKMPSPRSVELLVVGYLEINVKLFSFCYFVCREPALFFRPLPSVFNTGPPSDHFLSFSSFLMHFFQLVIDGRKKVSLCNPRLFLSAWKKKKERKKRKMKPCKKTT